MPSTTTGVVWLLTPSITPVWNSQRGASVATFAALIWSIGENRPPARSRLCSGQFTVPDCATSAAPARQHDERRTENGERRTTNLERIWPWISGGAIIIRAMRLIAALMFCFVLGGQTYPPPYPRAGTKALIDNARAQVWDVSWPKGTAVRHPSPSLRHDRPVLLARRSPHHAGRRRRRATSAPRPARFSGSSRASPTSRKAPATIRCAR